MKSILKTSNVAKIRKKVTFLDSVVIKHLNEDYDEMKVYRSAIDVQTRADRDRFDKKIQHLKFIIDPVLKTIHRKKIFKQRFSCDETSILKITLTEMIVNFVLLLERIIFFNK